MYKVININIGGRIFQVEENAFEALNNYIASLKKYFGDKPEGVEIVADIEHRIAELLQAKLRDKPSVTSEEVAEIIASMGSPKAIAGDESEEQPEPEMKSQSDASGDTYAGRSRIYRDPDGKVIGGVCSGLAYYFDMDSTIMRLIFVALFFAGGSSVFLYLILLIVIPEARTTAEKLAMRKEKINVDTIRKSVEEEFGRVKGNIERGDYQGRLGNFFQKIFHVIGLVVRAFVKFMVFMAGIFFAMMAVAFFISLFSLIIGNNAINGLHFGILDPTYVNFFENANDRLLSQVAIVTCLFAFVLIFFNMSRALLSPGTGLKNRRFFNRITATIGLLGLMLAIIASVRTVSYFKSGAVVENEIVLDSACRYFTIKTFRNEHQGEDFFVDSDSLNIRIRKLKIEYTEGAPELVQRLEARGQTAERAKVNTSNCKYNLTVKDSIIYLPESFVLKNNQAWRNQEVTFILRLPAGYKFSVDKKSNLRIEGEDNADEPIREGETYMVETNGMYCMGCAAMAGSPDIDENEYRYNYSVGSFKSVEVSSRFHVRIIKGGVSRVMVSGLDHESDMIVREDNGELTVHLKNKLFGSFDDGIEVLIVTPELNDIRITGAVDAVIEGFENDRMSIVCTGASSCLAKLTANIVTAEVSGASEMTLKGVVDAVDADISGAGKLHAGHLMARQVEVKASGASRVEIYANSVLKARATGAAKIEYSGHPSNETIDISGAGSIVRKG